MATEIQHRHTATGETVYFTIRNVSNQYWDAANSEPAWETLVVANWADYAISMTESPANGYAYAGTFPAAIAAGQYAVDIFEQQASDPAIDDDLLASVVFDWDGSAEVAQATILADTNELQAMFDDVDSTATETITAAKAIEIALAVVAGNTSYDSTTRTFTVYGRDGTTTLWTVKVSNTVHGTRTESTKA